MFGLNDLDCNCIVRFSDDNLVRNINVLGSIEWLGAVPKRESQFNTYYLRVVGVWNSLPHHIQNIDYSDPESDALFKISIKNYYHKKVVNMFDSHNTCI